MTDTSGRDTVAAVWRIESARIVGALARYTGDFALAEDLAQEALAEALVTWPREGVPRNAAGWLLTVGRRRAIDAFRRNTALEKRYAALAHDLREGGISSGSAPTNPPDGAEDVLWDPDRIDDDVLALMFIACHPVLSKEARIALTLRVVGGLTSDEIAKAFLAPTATVQARITRAKKTLKAARVPFGVPPPEERVRRLGSVLNVIYLIFTEGSTASSGDDLIRFDLAGEAQRLARVLARLMPDEPEVHGLLALLELTAARFPARTGPDGEPVLLEQQDRRRWAQSRPTSSDRPWPGRVRPAGGDRGVPRHRPVGRRDELGPHRAPLRGPQPPRAVTGGGTQPRGGGLHGSGAEGGVTDRGRSGRRRRPTELASAPQRSWGAVDPVGARFRGAHRIAARHRAVR